MGRIQKEIGYRFTIGMHTGNDLERLYKTDPNYIEFFLEITARLTYRDEKKRKAINEQLIIKADELDTSARIIIRKPDTQSDKAGRYRLRIILG